MGVGVPDYSTAIAGARSWRMANSWHSWAGGYLWSYAMLNPWPNGEEKLAECDSGHPAPARGCSCGVHAWYTPELMHRRGYGPRDHTHISGVVAGAGRVLRDRARVGSGYWVAERAVVLAFFDDGFPTPVKQVPEGSGFWLPTKAQAAEEFGVDVIRFDEYEEFCEEFGLDVYDGRG